MSLEREDAILARLEELSRDVRKQGRAAVAAQAAAEASHEIVRELAARATPASEPDAERWLRALMPVADALERLASRAESLARGAKRRWWWPRVDDRAGEIGALAEGVRIASRQLEAALESLGVAIERPVGAVDPTRHRVVETRAAAGAPGEIVEVVRAGYSLRGALVREADVVASATAGARREK